MVKTYALILLCCGVGDIGSSPWPEMPPAQYNHPYTGNLTIKTGDEAQIHAWCHSYFARACATVGIDSCMIYLPMMTWLSSPQVLEALKVHEIAHCNGWLHR